MTLDEFRRHPAYDYYIRTLVSNCLVCDTHLFGYLNPYYRAAYSIPKRKR